MEMIILDMIILFLNQELKIIHLLYIAQIYNFSGMYMEKEVQLHRPKKKDINIKRDGPYLWI